MNELAPEGILGFSETAKNPTEAAKERKIITPETLLADNRSETTHALRRIWETSRRHGLLTLEWDCVDARSRIPLKAAQVKTVATGADGETYEAFEGLINDKSILRVVVAPHRDKETDKKGVAPEGCGGLGVKRKQKAEEAPTEGGAHGFVDKKVYHDDPVIQAIVSAYRISHWTTKPVLAAIRDHLTQEVLPVAIFQRRVDQELPDIYSHPNVNVAAILAEEYRPEEIYTDGVPHLDVIDPRLEAFYTYFLDNKDEVIELSRRYPDLSMKTQDPDAIVISTQTRPLRTRYSDIFGKPGIAFEVTAARCRKTVDSGVRRISKNAVEEVLQQAEYAMEHALDHKEKSFRKTRTILIETTHIDESREIAQAIAETELGKKWVAEGRPIIVAEVRAGKIVDNKIEYFQPAA